LEGLAIEDIGTFQGHLAYFTAIGYILLPLGIFCTHLVYFMVIWYIFPHFGMLYQEKSGNPALKAVSNFPTTRFKFLNILIPPIFARRPNKNLGRQTKAI
jgi:hypothetical protein